jgi:hypothetical protein
MATIRANFALEEPSVTAVTKATLLYVALAAVALLPTRSSAQWWRLHVPVDFEECSESAQKTASSKEMLASLLSECDSKFPGRRKPGGGYTYYDFMQNRHFDIAGPSPTPEEQKHIDEQYTEFLDRQRQSIVAAGLTEKQNEQAEAELTKESVLPPSMPRIPIPVSRPRAAADAANCRDNSFSCGWTAFEAKIQNFKKTLLGPAKKDAHG